MLPQEVASPTPAPSPESRDEVVIVMWSGQVGGAETFSISLAGALQQRGLTVWVLFLTTAGPLEGQLESAGLPFHELGLSRGSRVVFQPRRYAAVATELGPSGALLVASGFLAGALRFGGYAAPIIAVEHGSVLQSRQMTRMRRVLRWLDRESGRYAVDAYVAVSDFLFDWLRGKTWNRRLARIYNGIDLRHYRVAPRNRSTDEPLIVGCAARLIAGKGVADLIVAAAPLVLEHAIRLRIAGRGPDLGRLQDICRDLGIFHGVDFLGHVSDIPAFWASCDVGVVPSNGWIESFGMSALEAMACGRPVIATRNGGLVDVVDAGSGALVLPGDTQAIRHFLAQYHRDPDLLRRHGEQARARAERAFSLADTAASYHQLLYDLQST